MQGLWGADLGYKIDGYQCSLQFWLRGVVFKEQPAVREHENDFDSKFKSNPLESYPQWHILIRDFEHLVISEINIDFFTLSIWSFRKST